MNALFNIIKQIYRKNSEFINLCRGTHIFDWISVLSYAYFIYFYQNNNQNNISRPFIHKNENIHIES